ncbi:MAG: choice-of-anchor L domain-containing protein [Ginsengibacter sp.]
MKILNSFALNLFRPNKNVFSLCFSFVLIILLQDTITAQNITPEQSLLRKKISLDKSKIKKPSSANSLTAACTSFTVEPVDATVNPLSQIIQSLVGPGVTISNIQTNLPATSDIYGSFSCASSVIGIDRGLILTSGSIANAKGPNSSEGAGRDNGLPGNTLLNGITSSTGFDAAVVSFNITPTGKTLTFNYVFASEEYNDYVNSEFNDVFGFFISGPGITGTQNIALLPGTTIPVAINNVNKGQLGETASNPQYFINNDDRTLPTIPQPPDPNRYATLEYDGLTVRLSVNITVIPGQTYTLTLGIQDVGDGILDSGVFIEGGSIQSNDDYYSKSSGDLHNVLTWGINADGSGTNPPDFGAGKTFHLVNRVPTYTMTANWTVGGRLDIPSGSQLRINGFTLSIADLIGTGSLYGSLTSSLVVTGTTGNDAGTLKFASGGNSLNNFTLNRTGTAASATVGTALNIYGVLTLTNGALNTGNNITLKSNTAGTARVAPVTGGTISGNVTVERYIPARRAWRIMSAPVGGTQKINAAWQEGATTSSANPNPNPGFGTHITEGTAANGFDHNPLVAMVSIKKYVSASNAWTVLTNTNSTNVNSDAYLLFVRGHRATPLGLNTVPPTNTVLRSTGTLKTGSQAFPVSATGFTAIGNPYASPINFKTITRTNVPDNFYLWDPKLGGANGVGGYVLLSANGSGGYDITPAAVSPESQYIQSGQGFLVHATTTGASIVIKESDKSATAATSVFRAANTTTGTAPVSVHTTIGLRSTLQINEEDQSTSVLDETFTLYGTAFSNEVNDMDPVKLPNINENLGIVRNNQSLMIERRKEFAGNDTINLQLWNTTPRNYQLQFTPVNLSSSKILSGYLLDKYLHTSTLVSLTEVTKVYFNVNGDAASANKDRFMVVLSGQGTLPAEIIAAKSAIRLSPNPINGRLMGIQLVNKAAGAYKITLFNNIGQEVYRKEVIHAGGSSTYNLQLTNSIIKGMYRVSVINAQEKSIATIPVLVK